MANLHPPSGPAPRAWVLVGPTAGGKTALAHRAAERLGARILSADALLVYRGMDIGTAKPSADELRAHGYAGVDLFDPDQRSNVGRYLDAVRAEVAAAPPDTRWVIVGGTGLYVRCLLDGLAALPPENPEARAEAEALLREGGPALLAERLRGLDAERFRRLRDPDNPRRLVRAYELARAGRAPVPSTWRPAGAAARLVGLLPDRDDLAARIAARARAMFAGGLLEEARALRERWGGRLSETARQAIGYREAWAALDGSCSVDEAVAAAALRTRQYAKRQLTWFRHQARVEWLPVPPAAKSETLVTDVLRQWETYGPAPLSVV